MLGDLGVAFIAGLLSCASACVLPLLPVYVAYMGGIALPATGAARPARRLPVVGNALLFVGGFSTAFISLGAGAGLVGADLGTFRPVLVGLSGVLLIVLGMALLGGIPWLMRERRLEVAHRLPRSPWASYLVGLAFAAGWTPCVGPILAAVLLEAASSSTAARGAVLLGAYSAGLGLPFMVAAVFLGQMTALIRRMRAAYPVINAAAAGLLIVMGLLTITNRLTVLNTYFPSFGPAVAGSHLSGAAPAADGPGAPVGRSVPSVTVARVDGERISLSSLRGQPVIVTFWATWCVPCRDELRLFAAAYRDHRSEGLEVVAIDYQESPDSVNKFWRELALEPAPCLDPDGAVARRFGVGLEQTGLPVTVLVGRDGAVRRVLPGQVDPAFFSLSLDQLLRT
jgi:cytochrome c-type biogenesis protein